MAASRTVWREICRGIEKPIIVAPLEELIAPLVEETVDCLLRTVAGAGLTPVELSAVLLVGIIIMPPPIGPPMPVVKLAVPERMDAR